MSASDGYPADRHATPVEALSRALRGVSVTFTRERLAEIANAVVHASAGFAEVHHTAHLDEWNHRRAEMRLRMARDLWESLAGTERIPVSIPVERLAYLDCTTSGFPFPGVEIPRSEVEGGRHYDAVSVTLWVGYRIDETGPPTKPTEKPTRPRYGARPAHQMWPRRAPHVETYSLDP